MTSTTSATAPTIQISVEEYERLQKLDAKHRPTQKTKLAKAPLPWDLRIFFAAIALCVLAQFSWLASGGSLFRVTTESMCPQVCVGSLVLDRPLPPNTDVKKGETVSFIPPGLTTVYTHRVVKVFANGTFLTKGDAANVKDPWVVAPSDVRGVAVATIWGLGYLSEALPFLSIGIAILLLLRRSFEVSVRRDYDRVFTTLIILVPIVVIKPLIRATTVMTTTLKHGLDRVTFVNTGLLPAQFTTKMGFRDFISPGQRVTMTAKALPGGRVEIKQLASFHWTGWLIVGFVIALPVVAFFNELHFARRHQVAATENDNDPDITVEPAPDSLAYAAPTSPPRMTVLATEESIEPPQLPIASGATTLTPAKESAHDHPKKDKKNKMDKKKPKDKKGKKGKKKPKDKNGKKKAKNETESVTQQAPESRVLLALLAR